MYHLLLIAEEKAERQRLASVLEDGGLQVTPLELSDTEEVQSLPGGLNCILIVPSPTALQVFQKVQEQAQARNVPSIALVDEEKMGEVKAFLPFNDFILRPLRIPELVARLTLALHRRDKVEGQNVLRFGDLAIDLEKYEVTLEGRVIDLTYKEYELLRLLATNKEKVFTRETLLNRIWGYDYYGGIRTVDVHIRRLRSKIEDVTHSFIDTVRGVGYKFKAK